MKYFNKNSSFILGLVLIAVSGCGGGGGGGGPLPNVSPTVSVSDVVAGESTTVTITATGADSDGSITGYSWVRVSGIEAELVNADTSSVSFMAPSVVEDSEMVLSVTVTDNDGASASANVTATISNTGAVSLTISGLVTDGPIPNANITLSIANQQFTTTADQNGLYSIDLTIDDSFADSIMMLTATGEETNTPTKLVSILGSVSDVAAAADSDGLVTKSDFFAVNVTNVTTATTALLERANGGLTITDKTSLENSYRGYRSDLVLPFATAIKLVLDYSPTNADFALPAGVANTFELVSDYDQVQDYIVSARANDQATYDQAAEEILTDDEVISSGTSESILSLANHYYFMSPEGLIGGGRLILDADGTGQHVESLLNASFDWSLSNDGISIDYGSDAIVESSRYEYDDSLQSYVLVEVISIGKNLKWVNQTATTDLLLLENITYRHYPNYERPDEAPEVSSKRIVSAVKSNGILDAAEILQVGASYSFPTSQDQIAFIDPKGEGYFNGNPFFYRAAAKMVFSGDVSQGGSVVVSTTEVNGDGTPALTTFLMEWMIDSEGHLILQQGEDIYDYVFLRSTDGKTPYVNFLATTATQQRAASYHALLKESPDWTTASAPGIYNLPMPFLSPLDYFWIEVNSDGTALTVSASDSDRSGDLSDNEFYLAPGMWIINAEGNLVIRRYRENSLNNGGVSAAYCTPLVYDPADDADCVLYHEREWDLHQVNSEDEYYMRHMHRFYDDSFKYWYQDPNVSGHILAYATQENRFWTKLASRPVTLPTSVNGKVVANSADNSNVKLEPGMMKMIMDDLAQENR